MRGIKYRIWDTKKKEMIYDSDNCNDHLEGYGISPEGLFFRWSNAHFYPWIEGLDTDDYFILLYTGLKDKNGKEIYESDIVNIERYDNEFIISVIKWDEFKWNTIATSSEMSTHDYLTEFLASHFYEVIGNIYENPELLKEK